MSYENRADLVKDDWRLAHEQKIEPVALPSTLAIFRLIYARKHYVGSVDEGWNGRYLLAYEVSAPGTTTLFVVESRLWKFDVRTSVARWDGIVDQLAAAILPALTSPKPEKSPEHRPDKRGKDRPGKPPERFWRTYYTVQVLSRSDKPLPAEYLDVIDVARLIENHIGTSNVEDVVTAEVTGEVMAQLLADQFAPTETLGLDADGNLLDGEEDNA